ncbi:MAG: hypothetical protein U0802_07665 [Candidatus Binatia bacterium]
MRAKTLVVTVTAGRTGTTFLTHLLALCPDTTSLHEPEPSFVPVLRLAQRDPDLARRFLLEYKLPFVAAVPTRRYVETGHLLGKGFLEPLLDLGLAPGVVALRRAPRRVATSLLSRRTVPGRGKLGLKYLLHPDDRGVLALPGWTRCSDYQLCFWYALEMERRQRDYRAPVEAAGGAWVDVTAEELHDADRFLAVAETLSLLDAAADRAGLRAAHARVAATTHNPNAASVAVADPAAEEAAVWAAVGAADLRAWIDARYAAPR